MLGATVGKPIASTLLLSCKLDCRMIMLMLPVGVSSFQHAPVFLKHCVPARYSSVAREARFMKKLVTGTRHSRKKWFKGDSSSSVMKDMSFMMTSQSSVYGQHSPKKAIAGRTLRRVGVLSTVFMENITELLATGGLATDITGLGLEVTEVKISSDFTTLNVYWYSSVPEKESQLESLLMDCAGQLRHTLSQLRVMGQVPPIIFVKDTKYTRLLEVENVLAKLDFGDDYEPSPSGMTCKIEVNKFTKRQKASISQQLEESLVTMDSRLPEPPSDEDEDTEVGESVSAPVKPKAVTYPNSHAVRQDTLGLNWERIMGEIQLEVAKTARKQKMAKAGVSGGFEIEPQNSADFPPSSLEEAKQDTNRKHDFLAFLKQRRILRSKAAKALSNEIKEREFLEQERQSRVINLEAPPVQLPQELDDYLDDEDTTIEDQFLDHYFNESGSSHQFK